MAVPHRLSRKLHEIFGIEAAEAMADWMNGIEGGQAELRGDIAELRHEMAVGFAKIDARFIEAREQMRAEYGALAAPRTEFAASKVDVLKWAIGSWIGSLALITALTRFGR